MNNGKVLFLLWCSLLIITGIELDIVTAMDWDNAKDYDTMTKTVTITNALGLPEWLGGEQIAKLQLLTPHVFNVMPGRDRLVAEISFNVADLDYKEALKEMEFYNLKSGKKIIRPLTYKYKVKTGVNKYPVFKESCRPDVKNGSLCEYVIDHYETEDVYSWVPLASKELSALPSKTETIGIFTDVYNGDYIEWIGTYYGVRVSEWAVWNSSFENGLTEYWNMSDRQELVSGAYNLSNNDGTPIFTTTNCKIGGCLNTTDHNNARININRDFDASGTGLTWNFWVRVVNVAADGPMITQGDGNTAFIQQFGGSYLGKSTWVGSEQAVGDGTWASGDWHMLTYTINASGYGRFYVNGTLKKAGQSSGWTPLNWSIGTNAGQTKDLLGQFDEMSLYNRELSATEIGTNGLYNGGAGMTRETGGTSPPTVILNSPESANYTTAQTLIFNCSSTDNMEIKNLTLWINGKANYTQAGTGAGNLNLSVSRNLGEGTYTFNCTARDDENIIGNSSTNKIIIDASAPSLILNNPANNSNYINQLNITINYSVSDSGIGLNTCWFNVDNSTNFTTSCYLNISSIVTTDGEHVLYFYVNDSFGNRNSTYNYFKVYNITYSEYHNPEIIEGELGAFYFNVSVFDVSNIEVNISYNGTSYAMDSYANNGTLIQFRKNVTAPLVSVDSRVIINYTFSINGNLAGGTVNTTQFIYNIPSLNIVAGNCTGTPLFQFDLKDEENLTTLTGDFEYNFYYGLSNSTMVRTYGNITSATNFSICFNTSINPSWIIGRGEIFYSSPGWVERRYYIFDDTTISSQSNITLYDLVTASQTSFKLEVEDTSLNPYSDVYTRLLRWYPNLNEYKIVDIGKTDETGSTVIHVKAEDVDYRIGVYYANGSLIYLANPIRMVCLVSPCTYTLKISPGETDYTSFLNVVYTFTFNETTGMWIFTYSDASGSTDTMNLTVWKDTGTSSYIICSDYVTGAAGTLSCNTSAYTGTLRGEVYRESSPAIQIAQKIWNSLIPSFKGSKWILWLSMFLALPVILFLAVVSPIAAVIGGVLALIPALFLSSVNIGIVSGIAILAGLVIHFLKRVG